MTWQTPVQTSLPDPTSRAVFPGNIPIVAMDDKTRLALALEMFGYKFLLASASTLDRLRLEFVQSGARS
jgi:hypothetical protein